MAALLLAVFAYFGNGLTPTNTFASTVANASPMTIVAPPKEGFVVPAVCNMDRSESANWPSFPHTDTPHVTVPNPEIERQLFRTTATCDEPKAVTICSHSRAPSTSSAYELTAITFPGEDFPSVYSAVGWMPLRSRGASSFSNAKLAPRNSSVVLFNMATISPPIMFDSIWVSSSPATPTININVEILANRSAIIPLRNQNQPLDI